MNGTLAMRGERVDLSKLRANLLTVIAEQGITLLRRANPRV